jgi:hypothetical protein
MRWSRYAWTHVAQLSRPRSRRQPARAWEKARGLLKRRRTCSRARSGRPRR